MNNYNMCINSVTNLKRKEFEQVTHDFCLSSPAVKIRRLNAELPPIVEEEDVNLPMRYDQVTPENVNLSDVGDQLKMPDIEELPPFKPVNDEKAIVLFKPMSDPLSYFATNISVDPSFISTLKNRALWGVNVNAIELIEKDDLTDGEVNACRAVIPWTPPHHLNLKPEMPSSQTEVSELDTMDAEELEVTTMEIEDEGGAMGGGQQTSHYYCLSGITDGMSSQWQKPHCLVPQPLQNTATPVVWYQ